MQTDELRKLANDFAQRMSDLDWLTDALLVAGMYPSTEPGAGVTQRTIEEHVILIGPSVDRRRPFRSVARSTRGDNDWIRVSPYMADVMDMDMFYDTLATQPRPTGDGKDLNILVVHYTRRGADGGSTRCFMAHHEEMDLPGASGKLADDAWVHDAFSLWLDDGSAVKSGEVRSSTPEGGVEVHQALIESHRRYMRHRESPSLSLMVELPGLDRHAEAERVSQALGDHEEVEFVCPTSSGTYVFISDGQVWPAVVERLVEGLDRLGQEAVVTAPPERDLWEGLTYAGRSVTAMMAYPMELAFKDGPLNPYGVEVRRWGVSNVGTERLLEVGTGWVSLAGRIGETGGAGPVIPAASDDSAELLALRLRAGQLNVGLIFRDISAGTARTLGLDTFGQVTYTEINDTAGLGFVEEAVGLSSVIRAEAALLDIAMIRPMSPLCLGSTTELAGGGMWNRNRHLWSSRVYDAHGIQLLTDQHLEHARDLSGWLVAKVADHRWLVTARDLHPWYGFTNNREWSMTAEREDAVPDFLAQARSDFGNMILTQEISEAHPAR